MLCPGFQCSAEPRKMGVEMTQGAFASEGRKPPRPLASRIDMGSGANTGEGIWSGALDFGCPVMWSHSCPDHCAGGRKEWASKMVLRT